MKVLICGKGGSGKSTVTKLLARSMNEAGKQVLVVDADESNFCLHRYLQETGISGGAVGDSGTSRRKAAALKNLGRHKTLGMRT